MNKDHLIIAAGVGVAGLVLLSKSGGSSSDGFSGFGGGGGGDDAGDAGNTAINFPELDLSTIWGEDKGPVNYDLSNYGVLPTKKTTIPHSAGAPIYLADPANPFTIKKGRSAGLVHTADLSKFAGTSIEARTGEGRTLPWGSKSLAFIGGNQSPIKRSSYYRGPLPTASSHAALTKKNVVTKGYSF